MVSLDRLASVTIIYLIFIMAPARKHTLEPAAKFSNSSKSRFNNFLKNHSDFAIHALHELSKKQARQFAATLTGLANNALPWNIAILVDSTFLHRSSLHTENAKRFNQGDDIKGDAGLPGKPETPDPLYTRCPYEKGQRGS